MLHSDSRSIVVGVLFLALDGIVFVVVYLGALTLVMPSTVRQLLRTVWMVLRRARRRRSLADPTNSAGASNRDNIAGGDL